LNGLSSNEGCIYRATETGKNQEISYTRKDVIIDPDIEIHLEAFHEAPRETTALD
jgi:hypothetical protein